MASVEDHMLIEKLKDAETFKIWRFQVEIMFKANGLYDIVSGTSKLENIKDDEKNSWKKKDAQAQKTIITTIDKKLMMHVLNSKNSFEMYSKICGIFRKDNEQQKCSLLQEFFNFKFDKNSDINLHISKMENLRFRLKALNQDVDDDMFISKILSTLPDQFKHFCTAWESTPISDRSLINLTSRLIAEELRLKQNEKPEESLAFKVEERKNKNRFEKKYSDNYSDRKCYSCGKGGHFARVCHSKNKTQCRICKKTNHKEDIGKVKIQVQVV